MNRRLDDLASRAPQTDALSGEDPGVDFGIDSGRAWAVVASAFFASAVALGVLYSFGVFLTPIATDLRASTAGVAAFFSITSLVFYALGAPAGHLADRYGPR